MSIDIRMPNITAATEKEQLAQIRSYLYQFVPQLQWALNSMETSSLGGGNVTQVIKQTQTQTGGSSTSQGPSWNELKSLIIKSADIVEAYYDEINYRLVSAYRALSDFGEYTEKTEKLVTDTAAFTETTYERLATIDTTIGTARDDIDGMMPDINEYRLSKGYIKTGFIVDSLTAEEAAIYGKQEGQSLIGVEVGDTTDGAFKKYARFTPTRLSFYDNDDKEVAYISNYKLYIHNVEVKGSLQEGGYKDFINANGGIVTKWVGGEG